MLKLKNITAGYGAKQVLNDLSLEVSAGEITALIGPNGAGKSTVLKVIAGLLNPSTGHVALDGKDITSLPTYRHSRLGIGYVMQNAPVFGNLTVAEHFRLAHLTPNGYSGLSKPAGVSPDIAKEIYAGIKRNITGTETAVLVVEQNIHYLSDFTNRVIVMRNGEIYRDDLPLENLANSEIMFETFYGN